MTKLWFSGTPITALPAWVAECTSLKQLYERFHSWVADMPATDQEALFGGTAKAFYGFGT